MAGSFTPPFGEDALPLSEDDQLHSLEVLLLQSSVDGPTVDWLLQHLFERSPEFILLLLCPVAILPATSAIAGAILVFVAIPMIAHRRNIFVPRVLGTRKIMSPRLARAVSKLSPLLKRYRAYARSRPNSPRHSHTRWAGILALTLAVALLVPLPLSNVLPGAAVGIVGLASLGGDMKLLLIASTITIGSVLVVLLEILSALHLAALVT